MAEISKQALKVENNTEFPNNNAGAITPSRLRTFNIDMIDSLVDEISYNADSASWEQSIAALEAFTGSATSLTTGSLLITASANLNTITFTKGDGSQFNVNVNTGSADLTDLGPLNAFTASVAGTNAFTQSANLRLNSLEATTASLNTSITNLNVFTQSIQTEVDNIQAVTASYATTGSNTFVGNQTIVGSVSASSFVSASKFVGDGSQITGITASVATSILNDGVFQGTATSLNFTGSGVNASVVAGVAIIEAEVDQSVLNRYATTASFNAFTQSIQAEVDNLQAATASYAISSSVAAVDNAQNQRLDSLESFTSSLDVTYVTQAELAAATGALEDSIDTKLNTSSFDAFSQSIDSRVDSLESFTASVAGINTFTASIAGTNAFTQSANARLNSIEAQSGSWVTSAITASSLQTASFAGGTLTFTKGDGSTFGVVIPDVSGSAGDFVTTASFNAYTQSNDTKWDNLGSQTGSFITESETGSFAKTSGITGFQTFNSNINNVFSGSTYIGPGQALYLGANTDIRTEDGSNIFISGSIYMNKANAGSELLVNNIKSLGNTLQYPGQSKVLNIYGDVDVSGSFTAPLQNGYAWVGDSTNKAVQVATSSFAGTTAAGTISSSAQITELGFVSSSITASSIVTASATNATITFTKGDASTFSVTVATGSAVSASYAETASLARNVVVIARNGGASTLGAGTVVHITSAVGDNPVFTTASYDTEVLSSNTFGLLRSSSPSGADVEVVVNGVVTGVDTDPALGYAAGDILYLSSSGQFTKVQPQAPLQIVTIGQVLRAQQNNGSIYVSISNGWELDELHNVQITSPQTNQLLAYESASYGLWKNKSFNQLGLATTGSNTFIGDQTITGSLLLTGSNSVLRGQIDVPQYPLTDLQNVIRFYQGTTGINGSSKLQFYSGSYESPNAGFVNLQSNPANGALAISAWPANNHFVDFDIATTSSIFTAPIGGAAASSIANTLVVRTNMTVSGSTSIALRVSSSAAGGGVGSFTPLGIQFQSGSGSTISANYGRNSTTLSDSTGAPTTIRLVGMAANPSLLGAPSVVGYTAPSILAMNSGSQPEPVISFQHRGAYTDGTITMVKPTTFLSGSIISGSTVMTGSLTLTGSLNVSGALTASLQEGYVWVGGVGNITTLVATSSFATTINTGSFATTGSNSFVGNQNINGQLNVTGSSSFTGSMSFLSGSASGSVVTNVGDTFTGTAVVTKIISLSSAEYTALSPKDPNTLYIIV